MRYLGFPFPVQDRQSRVSALQAANISGDSAVVATIVSGGHLGQDQGGGLMEVRGQEDTVLEPGQGGGQGQGGGVPAGEVGHAPCGHHLVTRVLSYAQNGCE